MKHSDTLGLIAPQLVQALSKIEGAAKTKNNPGFKGTKYADLETVIAGSREILASHGLTVIQLPGACAAGILNLETILMHESGEWISGEMGIALGKTDPQGVGSALTYARRYAQMAALNMPAVDDDGERAMGRVNGAVAPAQLQPIPSNFGRKSSAQAKRDGDDAKIKADIAACDLDGLRTWRESFDSLTATLPLSWLDSVHNMLELRLEELNGGAAVAEAEAELDAGFQGAVGGSPAGISRGDGADREAA